MKSSTLVLLVLAAAPAARAQTSVADAAVVAAVRNSDAFRGELRDDEIRIACSSGQVVLSGVVFEEEHLALAQEAALASPGVTSVRSLLTAGRPDPARDANAWIAAEFKRACLLHRAACAADADVDVQDGVVTLSGETVGEAQAAAATAYARSIPGVVRVENRMTVAGTRIAVESSTLEKMDDAAVTLRVKTALLLYGPRGANAAVKTRNGVVTLSGTAADQAGKERAERIARNAQGVEAVENRMTVASSSGA